MMTSPTITAKKSFTVERPSGRLGVVSRRVGHGGTAWATDANLVQPQDQDVAMDDGAAVRSGVTDISTKLQAAAFGAAVLAEPEDARITGGTRSLMRRVLGLNVRPVAKAAVKPVARAANVRRVQVA